MLAFYKENTYMYRLIDEEANNWIDNEVTVINIRSIYADEFFCCSEENQLLEQ